MKKSGYRDGPETSASTGFPLTVIFLSMLGILGYMLLGGEFTNIPHREARVFVPLQGDTTAKRPEAVIH
ncbi:hypothetical protein [Rhizobium tubonense]|uniref:Uncharacterized protein n=1 Tax=Rhizobium tubonense TaxID=484088 RepID=A0A2W4DVB2_9HYPH|nr:hypothetical protein [Rhizobium tubonense]PZM07976.1 hypothetical protein CPY51_29940 [Rhizobium tubonense]